jgi:hypothetical protein
MNYSFRNHKSGIILVVALILIAIVLAETSDNNSNTDQSRNENIVGSSIEQSEKIPDNNYNNNNSHNALGQGICIEYWKCETWSECSKSGNMTRTCIDQNSCSTNIKNPIRLQNCAQRPKILIHRNATKSAQEPNITASGASALFDIIIDVISEPKTVDEPLVTKISLINFGSRDAVNAELTYTIYDDNKNIAKTFHRIVPVKTQIEFIDYIDTTGLVQGRYYLDIRLKYAGQKESARAEKTFYIGDTNILDGIFSGAGVAKALITTMILCALVICNAYYLNYRRKHIRQE